MIELVKAIHKQQLSGVHGNWKQYLQLKEKRKLADPYKHTRPVLAAFVQSILDLPHEVETAGSESKEGDSEEAGRAKKFVKRYLKWQAARTQEAEARRLAAAAQVKAPTESQPGAAPATGETPANCSVASLVARTMAHPKFKGSYNFPSYGFEWFRSSRVALQPQDAPMMFAVDCEMCKTDEEENALLGVCVTNMAGEVVFKELVKPKGNVLDFRTAVTGATAADLEGITVRKQDVRKALKALLLSSSQSASHTGPTVLVGHALHHDLTVLALDHAPVIDTALLFAFQGLSDCTPSLKDLARAVLGIEMRAREEGRHDSKEDASVAMQLVAHELARTHPTPPLPPPVVHVSKEDLCKLLLHSIPKDATNEQITALFQRAPSGPQPVQLEGSAADKKLTAVFKHAGDANDAFKLLEGQASKDSAGRAFKEVTLSLGRNIKVRKMACHNGLAFLHRAPSKPRPAGAPVPTADAAAPAALVQPAPAALLSSALAAAAAAAAGTLEPKAGREKEKKPTRRGPRKHVKPQPSKPDADGVVAPAKAKKPYRGNKRAGDKKAGQNAPNKRSKQTPAVKTEVKAG
ncbi:MAG: hypothetical protein WDW36_005512 [Sanguina aurantia]